MDREQSRAAFITALHARLDRGAVEHGERSFDLRAPRLVEELQAEALDLAGWGWILWDRLERLKRGAELLETAAGDAADEYERSLKRARDTLPAPSSAPPSEGPAQSSLHHQAELFGG